jgi:hypothetical protein
LLADTKKISDEFSSDKKDWNNLHIKKLLATTMENINYAMQLTKQIKHPLVALDSLNEVGQPTILGI